MQLNARKAELGQIQFINESVDHANWFIALT